MYKCRCSKIQRMTPEKEKRVMINGFVVFSIIQTLAVTIFCSISMYYISSANISFFFSVDLTTLLMTVILLSIIILIFAWSSALNNLCLLWFLFHCFMFILLVIEMAICMVTSNVDSFVNAAQKTWYSSEDSEKTDLEFDLMCCGFLNTSDQPGQPCPEGVDVGCAYKLEKLMTTIRNMASVALFVCFVFGMFIDFAGCGICFHPDFISFQDHQKEEEMITNYTESKGSSIIIDCP